MSIEVRWWLWRCSIITSFISSVRNRWLFGTGRHTSRLCETAQRRRMKKLQSVVFTKVTWRIIEERVPDAALWAMSAHTLTAFIFKHAILVLTLVLGLSCKTSSSFPAIVILVFVKLAWSSPASTLRSARWSGGRPGTRRTGGFPMSCTLTIAPASTVLWRHILSATRQTWSPHVEFREETWNITFPEARW